MWWKLFVALVTGIYLFSFNVVHQSSRESRTYDMKVSFANVADYIDINETSYNTNTTFEKTECGMVTNVSSLPIYFSSKGGFLALGIQGNEILITIKNDNGSIETKTFPRPTDYQSSIVTLKNRYSDLIVEVMKCPAGYAYTIFSPTI